MKKKIFTDRVLVAILCAILLAGTSELCFAKSVVIKNVTVVKGQTYKIRCKKKCRFISNNTKVATVSKKGVIKAKRKGKCIIELKVQNKLVKKYRVKVVKKKKNENPIRVPEQNFVQTPAPEQNVTQTPAPEYSSVGGTVFCLGRCVVSSSNKINHAEYETMVYLDELSSKTLSVCFEECINIKYIIIKTDMLYNKDKLLNIVLEKGESTYTIINNDTVAIAGYKLAK